MKLFFGLYFNGISVGSIDKDYRVGISEQKVLKGFEVGGPYFHYAVFNRPARMGVTRFIWTIFIKHTIAVKLYSSIFEYVAFPDCTIEGVSPATDKIIFGGAEGEAFLK